MDIELADRRPQNMHPLLLLQGEVQRPIQAIAEMDTRFLTGDKITFTWNGKIKIISKFDFFCQWIVACFKKYVLCENVDLSPYNKNSIDANLHVYFQGNMGFIHPMDREVLEKAKANLHKLGFSSERRIADALVLNNAHEDMGAAMRVRNQYPRLQI